MTWGCNASSACMLSHFSRVRLFVTPRTVARQAPLSMGFSRQGYWRRLPFPPAGDLPDPGLEPTSLTSPALAGGSFTTSAPLGQPVEWNRKKTHVRNGTTDEENKLYFFFSDHLIDEVAMLKTMCEKRPPREDVTEGSETSTKKRSQRFW